MESEASRTLPIFSKVPPTGDAAVPAGGGAASGGAAPVVFTGVRRSRLLAASRDCWSCAGAVVSGVQGEQQGAVHPGPVYDTFSCAETWSKTSRSSPAGRKCRGHA